MAYSSDNGYVFDNRPIFRGGVNRVAKRIKEQSEKIGKPVTMDTAKRELAKHLTQADNRKKQRSN